MIIGWDTKKAGQSHATMDNQMEKYIYNLQYNLPFGNWT